MTRGTILIYIQKSCIYTLIYIRNGDSWRGLVSLEK